MVGCCPRDRHSRIPAAACPPRRNLLRPTAVLPDQSPGGDPRV